MGVRSHLRYGGRAVRLKLEKLREARNRTGTVGTPGTMNICADSSVPSPSTLPGKVGTGTRRSANLFPVFPVAPSTRGYKIPSIHAGVPAVPIVPREKHAVMLGLRVRDPLAGDPAAWEDELHQWTMAHCVFRDRALGGLTALHRHYVEWSHATGNIPPATLATFREWIVWQGFTLSGPLVHGLVLIADLENQESGGRIHCGLPACRLPRRPRSV